MAQLSPMWTKKRIPDDELEAYLNGNPTQTTGPQHFLYKPNYNDCLAANDAPTSGGKNAQNRKRNESVRKRSTNVNYRSLSQRLPMGPDIRYREYKLIETREGSKSMDSKIPISKRFPMGPDIRYREYKSYKPFSPSPACSVDTFKRKASCKHNNKSKIVNTTKDKHIDVMTPPPVLKQQITYPKKEKQIIETIILPVKKEIPEEKVISEKKVVPVKKVIFEKKVIPEKKVVPEKKDIPETVFVEKKEKKNVQIEMPLNDVIVYQSLPKVVNTTIAALAWRRMYEQHSVGAREGLQRSMRWDATIDF